MSVSLQFQSKPRYPQGLNTAVDHSGDYKAGPVEYRMDLRTTSASSRAVFLFVVQKGEASLRRLARLVARFLTMLSLAVLRVILTSVVFATCVMVMLHYLGVPVPGPSELLDKFEAVGQLTRILS